MYKLVKVNKATSGSTHLFHPLQFNLLVKETRRMKFLWYHLLLQVSIVLSLKKKRKVPVEWCNTGTLEPYTGEIICPAEISGLQNDICQDKAKPCGTWCHSYWGIHRVYCEVTGQCVNLRSEENLRCRNQEHGCKEGEHYCRSSGQFIINDFSIH